MANGRTLADGMLVQNNVRQVVYTVPDGMSTRISWMSVFNIDGAVSVQVTVFVRRFGEVRRISRVVLDAGGGHARVIDSSENLVLAEGDAIEAVAVTADDVEFTVSGIEEPVDGA